MKKPEQVEQHTNAHGRNRYRRFLKISTRRQLRRIGKRLLDQAPKRIPFRGYEY